MDVSIIICTFNSTKRIGETLAHLLRQEVPANIKWEILIVDYASSDKTIEVAKRIWKRNEVPLRIFREKRAGKSPALETGFENAQGEAVCVVDDDNWVAEDYVQIAHDVIASEPTVGVVGACGVAACEVAPPYWFCDLQYMYAVGHQAKQRGFTKGTCCSFWGAGSVIRRSAWKKIKARGFMAVFNPSRSDGLSFNSGFSGGEDPELCFAIQLVGYRLWYEPSLKYKHYIPSGRLTMKYVEETAGGVAMAAPILKVYQSRVWKASPMNPLKTFVLSSWTLHMSAAIVMYALAVLRWSPGWRSPNAVKARSAYRGQVRGLWFWRYNYASIIQRIDRLMP